MVFVLPFIANACIDCSIASLFSANNTKAREISFLVKFPRSKTSSVSNQTFADSPERLFVLDI